jgi:phage shock protein A
MLDDLKNLFSRTWGAFQAERSRREPEDEVAELLTAMRREMVEARASLPVLDEALARAQAEVERERKALDDCRRRGELAARIGDAETVRVAGEFAERHARRVEVLEEKLRAARAERSLRAEEIERMSRQYRKAEAGRFALVARLRARERVSPGSADPFDDFARISEEIEHRAAHAEAMEELTTSGPGAPPPPTGVEERLRELKRRMGQE